MTNPKWHEEKDDDLRPEPVLYRLETEIDGEKWSLRVVARMKGSPRRKTLQLPKHDAERSRKSLSRSMGGNGLSSGTTTDDRADGLPAAAGH